MKSSSKDIFIIWGCVIMMFLIHSCESSTLRSRNLRIDDLEDKEQEITASTTQTIDTTEVVTDIIDGENNVTGLANEDSESSANNSEGGSVSSGEEEKVEESVKPSSAPSLEGEGETTQAAQSEDSDSDSDSSSSDSDSESTSSDETGEDSDTDSSDSSADEDSSSGSSEENLKEATSDKTEKLKKPDTNPEKVKFLLKVEKVKKNSRSRTNKKDKL